MSIQLFALFLGGRRICYTFSSIIFWGFYSNDTNCLPKMCYISEGIVFNYLWYMMTDIDFYLY